MSTDAFLISDGSQWLQREEACEIGREYSVARLNGGYLKKEAGMSSLGMNFKLGAMALCLALSAGGCTMASGAWPVAQSHFSFPNSNVVPLGQGKGEASRMHFFTIMAIDPAVMEEAVQDAIKQKGGDMLLDYYAYYEIKQYIPMILTSSKWTVEGTVAKMEIGKQKLH